MAKKVAKPRARRVGLTPERRQAALGGYRESGVYAHVAKAMGVGESTFHNWRKVHPDFDEELKAIGREIDLRIGHLYRSATEQHALDVLARKRVIRHQQALDRDGQVHTLEHQEPTVLNVSLARTALTKLDPEWTRPPLSKEEEDKVKGFIDEVLSLRKGKGTNVPGG